MFFHSSNYPNGRLVPDLIKVEKKEYKKGAKSALENKEEGLKVFLFF